MTPALKLNPLKKLDIEKRSQRLATCTRLKKSEEIKENLMNKRTDMFT